jgi:tetratricopeptide (TPR) repeat protein
MRDRGIVRWRWPRAARMIALAASITGSLFGALPAPAQSDSADGLPMYGQPRISRPEKLKQADESFIRDATFRYKTRQAASQAFAGQGWTAVRSGQLDEAMPRFNQAWLLNPKNYSAYWGFGAVLSRRGKLAEALEHLENARQLIDDPTQRVALLSDLGTLHSEYATRLPKERELERAQHFVLANSRFAESLENDPKFATGWREWAMSLYEQERYAEAWVKVKQAQDNGAEPFPPEFLKKLAAKFPEPG